MAVRPWITPVEVKTYTDKPNIKARADEKVQVDIARAEQYVISYTNNRFDDAEKYPDIPAAVKTAAILIAEIYGNHAVEGRGEYASETFDDYSYTVADTAKKLENLDLGPLLDEFVIVQPRNAITLRCRKI